MRSTPARTAASLPHEVVEHHLNGDVYYNGKEDLFYVKNDLVFQVRHQADIEESKSKIAQMVALSASDSAVLRKIYIKFSPIQDEKLDHCLAEIFVTLKVVMNTMIWCAILRNIFKFARVMTMVK